MKELIKGAALFAGGALLGAAAALLLAPKNGEEMRNDLKNMAEEAKKQVRDYCEKLKQELGNAAAEQAPEAAETKEA